MGRTKSSAKQAKFRALVGEGVSPLEAARQAGYAYPGRELQRQAAKVAEARGADPMGVLVDMLRYGGTSDRIAAASAILSQPESSTGDTDVHRIMLVGIVPAEAPRGVIVHPTQDDALAAAEAASSATHASETASPHQLARATLRGILEGSTKTTDAQLVAAARALLKDNPEPETTTQHEQVVYVWIDCARGPLPSNAFYFDVQAAQ